MYSLHFIHSKIKSNVANNCWATAHPALLYWPEKESLYLSPNYSFQAAWPSQLVTGWSKQLGKKNWGWDTSSLSLVSALLPAVVLNYLPQVLILCKLSNKLHQQHISSIWSMALTITYIHIVELCSFCSCNNSVYWLSLPYNIKSLIL